MFTTAFLTAFNRRMCSSTVDAQEIEHFKQFTDDWWNEFGRMKPLHSMNLLRVPFIRDTLINEGIVPKEQVNTATPLKGVSILDVGCGGGILSEPLSRLGAEVTGIDANPDLINLAKRHATTVTNTSINYLFTTIENHAKDNCEKYDAIAASEIIEHVTEKEQFIAACAQCLKPSGSIFISTINKTWLANLCAISMAENVIKLVPSGTHQFEKFIKPHKVQRMLEDNNIHTKLIHGMFYNFISNKWSWCSNKSVNYFMHAVKHKTI